MATSTLRAAIIVAAIVLGGIVLANAFPGQVSDGPSTNQTTLSPTPTGGSPTSPAPTAKIAGATLRVLNGTTTAMLARDVADCLIAAGALIPDDNVGNANEDYANTTLVWIPGEQPLARLLQERFFAGAKLQGGQEVPDNPDVQVTVIVGADYTPAQECA